MADDQEYKETVRRWLKEAEESGETSTYEAKRSSSRYSWNCAMELVVDGDGLNDDIMYVYTRDVSAKGVGLTCRQNLPDGTRVVIRRARTEPWIPARIAHSTESVGTHKIGIELQFDF